MEYLFTVSDDSKGKRIDKFLSENIEDISRSQLATLIEEKSIFVNNNPVSKSYKLNINDYIMVSVPEPVELEALPEDIPLDIIFEDEDIIVINKPKGMVVHPAAGNYTGTLVNALLFHCKGNLSGINGVLRPGIVHRIDKNTSGLLVIAKTDLAHKSLSEQIKEHSMTREYRAIIYGHLKDIEGMVDAPIGRSSIDRKKMCVTDKNSKHAVTHYTVLEEFKDYSYVSCKLETGRTHQIRVHMAYIGHPLAGDDVYGPKKVITELSGQCLHAIKLGFLHPKTQEYMEFNSELPEYFKKFLNKIKKTYNY
ncbi:MAG: RluA family pseudouridine synthase [Ruminococcaceae bacterium]|nr:RluA family pseudouridine synthase [Oscillospiraceae bacterium]